MPTGAAPCRPGMRRAPRRDRIGRRSRGERAADGEPEGGLRCRMLALGDDPLDPGAARQPGTNVNITAIRPTEASEMKPRNALWALRKIAMPQSAEVPNRSSGHDVTRRTAPRASDCLAGSAAGCPARSWSEPIAIGTNAWTKPIAAQGAGHGDRDQRGRHQDRWRADRPAHGTRPGRARSPPAGTASPRPTLATSLMPSGSAQTKDLRPDHDPPDDQEHHLRHAQREKKARHEGSTQPAS